VGTSVGAAVGSGVGASVCPGLGGAVSSGVGANVSAGVGKAVNARVGAGVSTASVIISVDTSVDSIGIVDVPCTFSVGAMLVGEVVDGLYPGHMKQNSMNRIWLHESSVDAFRQDSMLIGATSFPSPAVRL